MSATRIEWTDAVWNPVRGCSRVSAGCINCYAERQAMRFAGHGQPYEGLVSRVNGHPTWTGEVRLLHDKLSDPLKWKKPRRIFVNSMSDLFHERVPYEFIDMVFSVMGMAPQHTFQVLTKRPQRMLEYLSNPETPMRVIAAGTTIDHILAASWWADCGAYDLEPLPLSNLWLGVSVEDQATANERIPLLLEAPAAVRWISCEPLLGPIDLDRMWITPSPSAAFLDGRVTWKMPAWTRIGAFGLDWVVVGGESGPNARPMREDWARHLRNQCSSAGVPFFFKQWGEWAPRGDIKSGYLTMRRVGNRSAGRLLDGRTWDEFPVKKN